VRLPGNPSLPTVAQHHGCAEAAVVGLRPYVIDGEYAVLLGSLSERTPAVHLLDSLSARTIVGLRADSVLLGLALGSLPQRVLADARMLAFDEVVFCVEPPGGYAIASPMRLIEALGAVLIS